MAVYNKDIIQILLLSVIILMVPLFYFPSKFGLDLASGSFIYSFFEIAFYGFIFYFLRPGVSLAQLFAGAGATFLYRIIIGTLFGGLLALLYQMDFAVSLTLGISKYLPAIFLHIIAAPFIMKPVFTSIIGEQKVSHRAGRPSPSSKRQKSAQPGSARQSAMTEEKAFESFTRWGSKESSSPGHSVTYDTNGFERAVKYLGEHHAVLVATVVDQEGLTMARFSRPGSDVEKWAPLALPFHRVNENIIKRNARQNKIEKLDLAFDGSRLIISRVASFDLMILANREEDELLNIRIAQAADIIKKYISERYDRLLSSGTEEEYVSSTGRTE